MLTKNLFVPFTLLAIMTTWVYGAIRILWGGGVSPILGSQIWMTAVTGIVCGLIAWAVCTPLWSRFPVHKTRIALVFTLAVVAFAIPLDIPVVSRFGVNWTFADRIVLTSISFALPPWLILSFFKDSLEASSPSS